MKKHHYFAWIAVAIVAWYFRAQILAEAAKLFASLKSYGSYGVTPQAQTIDSPASTLAAAVDSAVFTVGNPTTPGPRQYPVNNTSLLAPGQVIDRFGRDVTPDYFGSRVGDPLGDPQLRTHDIFGNLMDPFDASYKLIGGGYGGGGTGLSAQAYFRGYGGGGGPDRVL